MTSLLIKDLSLAQRVDREAASTVHGGFVNDFCGTPPGNSAPWPWPIAGMPVLPAMPMCPFPPCGYNPDASDPAPADRAIRL
jgi:hypothetical protein